MSSDIIQHTAPNDNAIDAPKISFASRCHEPIISQGKPIMMKEKIPIVENRVNQKSMIHLLQCLLKRGVLTYDKVHRKRGFIFKHTQSTPKISHRVPLNPQGGHQNKIMIP